MMKNERFFLGIELPSLLNREVEELQQKVYPKADLLSPLPPHITLVPPSCAATVEPTLFLEHTHRISEQTKPTVITLVDFGIFGGRSIHLSAKSDTLNSLHTSIMEVFPEEIRDRYYRSSTRQFNPHVTLAQAPSHETLPLNVVAECVNWSASVIPVSFPIDHLTIFVNQGGRTYIPQRQFMLKTR